MHFGTTFSWTCITCTRTINVTSRLSIYLPMYVQRTECEIGNGPRNSQRHRLHRHTGFYSLAKHGNLIQTGFRMSDQRVFLLHLCDSLWSDPIQHRYVLKVDFSSVKPHNEPIMNPPLAYYIKYDFIMLIRVLLTSSPVWSKKYGNLLKTQTDTDMLDPWLYSAVRGIKSSVSLTNCLARRC